MPDDLDTDKAQDQDQQTDQDQPGDTDKDQDKDKKPFTPEQEQYLRSWFGRIAAKQIDEKVLPELQTMRGNQSVMQTGTGGNPLAEFKERISEKLFEDPVGAIYDVLTVYDQAKTNLSKNQKTQVDKSITSMSEEPYYKDIYPDMKKIAHDAVSKGMTPGAAADYAYTKAKSNLLESRLSDTGDKNLGLMEGGRRSPPDKKPKLPAVFKKACARDMADGLFKNEQEYIDALSPEIREKYGLD